MGIFKENSGRAVECLLGTLGRTRSSVLDFALSHTGYSHGLSVGLRGEGTVEEQVVGGRSRPYFLLWCLRTAWLVFLYERIS